MIDLVCTIIISLIPLLAVYMLNEWSKRRFFKKQAKEQREFEKAKKKYDVKLERYEQLSNSLYKMVDNLERMKLLITVEWNDIKNLEKNIALAFSIGVMSVEDEKTLGTKGIIKSFNQYNELIEKIDPESEEGKEEVLEWMLTLVRTLITIRLRLFDVFEKEFWRGQSSLELIDREKRIRQKAFDVGKMVFKEVVEIFSKYELGILHRVDVRFIDKATDELRILREMMFDDIEKTL